MEPGIWISVKITLMSNLLSRIPIIGSFDHLESRSLDGFDGIQTQQDLVFNDEHDGFLDSSSPIRPALPTTG